MPFGRQTSVYSRYHVSDEGPVLPMGKNTWVGGYLGIPNIIRKGQQHCGCYRYPVYSG